MSENLIVRSLIFLVFTLSTVMVFQYLFRILRNYGGASKFLDKNIGLKLLKETIGTYFRSVFFFILPCLIFFIIFSIKYKDVLIYAAANKIVIMPEIMKYIFDRGTITDNMGDIIISSLKNSGEYFFFLFYKSPAELFSIIITVIFVIKNNKHKMMGKKTLLLEALIELTFFILLIAVIIMIISGLNSFIIVYLSGKALDILFLIPKSLFFAVFIYYMIIFFKKGNVSFKGIFNDNFPAIKNLFIYSLVLNVIIVFINPDYFYRNIDDGLLIALYTAIYSLCLVILLLSFTIPCIMTLKNKNFMESVNLFVLYLSGNFLKLFCIVFFSFFTFFIINFFFSFVHLNFEVPSIDTLIFYFIFKFILFIISGFFIVFFLKLNVYLSDESSNEEKSGGQVDGFDGSN